jgi:hypothetical protein
MTAREELTSKAGGCNNCPDRSHKVWVIHLGSTLQVRLCRACLAELKQATR